MRTRVVVTKKPNEVVVEEHDLKPGDNEVLVKTYLASICGTDKNYSEGKMPREVQVEQVDGNNEAHHAYPLKMQALTLFRLRPFRITGRDVPYL